MDRAPKKPPFPVGTRLRYTGASTLSTETRSGKTVILMAPGIEQVIDQVHPGFRGTLRQIRDEDGPLYDDTGEPILDETQDGYSVYHVTVDGQRWGRVARPEDGWVRV